MGFEMSKQVIRCILTQSTHTDDNLEHLASRLVSERRQIQAEVVSREPHWRVSKVTYRAPQFVDNLLQTLIELLA